ncbi:MAG TPA: hypothetical protein VM406_06730 [Noviherbaspirillum sp.]|nr:hypothetical protein [Noviherbaspirillum sp.]
MNAAAAERAMIPPFIFGDPQLHARFSTAITLMTQIMRAAPAGVPTAQLAATLGQSARALAPVLRALCAASLIERADDVRASGEAWLSRRNPRGITLADLFCSVANMPGNTNRSPAGVDDDGHCAARQAVELLLMQATMSINQVVLQRLQAFDLERLTAIGRKGALDSVYARTSLRTLA